MANKISVAIATYNEEENIQSCLDAVASWVDEIVIVDGGSKDATVEIAKKYNAKIIVTDNPPIFHINKQKALDACHGDWILQLDADEIVTPELREEIIEKIKDQRSKIKDKSSFIVNHSSLINGYYIARKNFFLGHWLHKGGQYPDYVIRLFKRGKGKFPCKSVHEQIQIDGSVGYFINPLLHYTSRTLNEYWRKANTYIALTVEGYEEKRLPLNPFTYMEYNFFKPMITFFLLFLRHKGFLDGYYGFLFALFSAMHYPKAYWKYKRLGQK